MSEHTPTTEDVTTAALAGGIYSEAEFDRWLAAERAKAARDALHAAASRTYSEGIAAWLCDRADKIGSGS